MQCLGQTQTQATAAQPENYMVCDVCGEPPGDLALISSSTEKLHLNWAKPDVYEL